jgi:hypothetical protein
MKVSSETKDRFKSYFFVAVKLSFFMGSIGLIAKYGLEGIAWVFAIFAIWTFGMFIVFQDSRKLSWYILKCAFTKKRIGQEIYAIPLTSNMGRVIWKFIVLYRQMSIRYRDDQMYGGMQATEADAICELQEHICKEEKKNE